MAASSRRSAVACGAVTPRQTESRALSLPKIASGLARCSDYPRAGMIDILKLLGGWLAGLFISHTAREAKTAFLRQQLFVLQRSAPARGRLRTADRLTPGRMVMLERLIGSIRCECLDHVVVFGKRTCANSWQVMRQ